MASYAESEIRRGQAVTYRLEHPDKSYRWLEEQFNVKKDLIRRRVKQLQVSRSHRPKTNLRFTPEQDIAFSLYLRRLYEIGVPLRFGSIKTAADDLLKSTHEGSGNPPKVGINWATSWLRQHPEFRVLLQKPIEENRFKALSRDVVDAFFAAFKKAIEEHGIRRTNIYNMDETGLRIGVGRGQWVIVPADDLYQTITIRNPCYLY
jgi:hypothetical protein